MRILLVEDDTMLGEAVRDRLSIESHAVDWIKNVADADAALGTINYDLVLLDLMLPDGSGLSLLRDARSNGDTTPVIVMTARDQISERIAGLNAGADDYLVKPCDLNEMIARVAAVGRRYAGNPNPNFRIDGLEVDMATKTVTNDGRPVRLTAREWALLEALASRPGHLLSKAQLEERLYSFDREFESNTVEVLVSRLRKKLDNNVIETVRGLGYRLSKP